MNTVRSAVMAGGLALVCLACALAESTPPRGFCDHPENKHKRVCLHYRPAHPIAAYDVRFQKNFNDWSIDEREVYNGRAASHGQYPSTVLITDRPPPIRDPEQDPVCTGVLIARDIVVTASHCVDGGISQSDSAFVKPGSIVSFGDSHDTMHVSGAFSTVVKRVQASGQADGFDIALLQLRDAAPAAFPPVPIASSQMIAHAKGIRVVGFGFSELLADPAWRQNPVLKGDLQLIGQKRYADLVIASSHCDGSVTVPGRGTFSDKDLYHCEPHFELVAAGTVRREDTCGGDSGGPAFVTIDPDQQNWKTFDARLQSGVMYLAAVTSSSLETRTLATLSGDWSPAAERCGDGGVYTLLDSAVDDGPFTWLKKQMTLWREPPNGTP